MKVNLGAGEKQMDGYINTDIIQLPGISKKHVFDIQKDIFPFKDGSIEHFHSDNVFEHIQNIQHALTQIARCLKTGGTAKFIVPHFTSIGAYKDPTHVRFFTYETPEYFCKDSRFGYYYNLPFKIKSRKIEFLHGKAIWNKAIQWFANKWPRYYETFLKGYFPAHILIFELEKTDEVFGCERV